MREPVWDVVATVDEPAPLVLAFAAHTLSLGPRCLHLYLDQPNPEVEAALQGIDRVKVTLCTPEYWAKSARRMRPPLHVGRQKENARQVYDSTPAEWMVSIDADEFLSSGADITADLAEMGEAVSFMRIAVRERVMLADVPQQGMFDGIFRMPLANFKQHGPEVYSVFADFLRHGMTGHAVGKSAFRTGRGLQMCLHAPLKAPPGVYGRRSFLRHFDGLTPLHYALKLLRRAREPLMKGKPRHGAPRLLQLQTMAEIAGDAPSIMEMVDYLKTLRPGQVQALRDLDRLDETPFDPSPALAALGLPADVSTATFDAALRLREREMLAATGLAI
jgi:hypothetical protein